MNCEYEDDDTSYFDSLAGLMNYETHQAAYQQRLTAPIRRTFATTPPGIRRNLSSTQTQRKEEKKNILGERTISIKRFKMIIY